MYHQCKYCGVYADDGVIRNEKYFCPDCADQTNKSEGESMTTFVYKIEGGSLPDVLKGEIQESSKEKAKEEVADMYSSELGVILDDFFDEFNVTVSET